MGLELQHDERRGGRAACPAGTEEVGGGGSSRAAKAFIDGANVVGTIPTDENSQAVSNRGLTSRTATKGIPHCRI
jgi:hypothetical protein